MLTKETQRADSDKGIPTLVLSTDENYALPLTVTIYSALRNHRQGGALKVFILDSGLTSDDRRKVEQLLSELRFPIQWIDVSSDGFQGLPVASYTIATYNRLFIPEVLPATIKKVIYLDCDLLIEGDISELWQQDPGDAYLMAVQGQSKKRYIATSAISRSHELKYEVDDPYFNAGILVMNLDQFRQRQLAIKALDFIRENISIINNADQDGLNAVSIKHWIQLDPKWNQYAKPARGAPFKRRPGGILHFTAREKPWLAKEARYYRKARADVYEGYQRYLREVGWFSYSEWLRYATARRFYKVMNLSSSLLNRITRRYQ